MGFFTQMKGSARNVCTLTWNRHPFVREVNIVNSYQASKRWFTRSLAIFTLWAAQWNQQFFLSFILLIYSLLYRMKRTMHCKLSGGWNRSVLRTNAFPFALCYTVLNYTTKVSIQNALLCFAAFDLYRCLNLCSIKPLGMKRKAISF